MLEKPQLLKVRSNIDVNECIRIPDTNIIISKQEMFRTIIPFEGLTWSEAHSKLGENGLFMSSPTLFMSYFIALKEAGKGKRSLYDAVGNQLGGEEINYLYRDLAFGVSTCTIWLDTKFVEGSGLFGLDIETDHRIINGNLVALKKEPLESCLEEDCFVELKFNSQGLPIQGSAEYCFRGFDIEKLIVYWKHSGKEKIFYEKPMKNAVSGFYKGCSIHYNHHPENKHSCVFACADAESIPC